MAEPFKNLINKKLVEGMALHFQKHWQKFDAKGFVSAATEDLESLELKARTDRITEVMLKYLPADFEKAGHVMLASLGTPLGCSVSGGTVDENGIAGWAVMPMTHYVGLRGHNHFDLSMKLFKEMTKRASSEFGIRFFLIESPVETLSVLKTWSSDKDQHVRRLISEGTRPRLPWAMRLPAFIKDPSPVIDLLERLKDDDSEYVRRSVANNLNDIAKDHPEVVADIAELWMKGANKEGNRMIRHACRTLVKSGHKKTLKVLGYETPKIRQACVDILTPQVVFGDALQFKLSISSSLNQDQALAIDYIIHHQKANGTTSPKVFKWRTMTLPANGTLASMRKHVIKKITTRVYYPGLHTLEVMVNGVSAGKADFQLIVP